MAGGETIAAQMEHMIQQMAMNPQVQRKVQAEIDHVIGPERWPTHDDKKRSGKPYNTFLVHSPRLFTHSNDVFLNLQHDLHSGYDFRELQVWEHCFTDG